MPTKLEALLPFRPKRRDPRIRLICFPFAGGAAAAYREWGDALPDHVDVCAVELPGRGTRFGETPIQRLAQLKEEVSLLTSLSDVPVVYFGHSMGARIAFSLVRSGGRADAIVLSAARAGHIPAPVLRGQMTNDALTRELRKIGGTPRVVLDDKDMLELLLPVVRADFCLLEGLNATVDEQVRCPMTVLAATDDLEVPVAEVEKWKVHAEGTFRLVTLDGGHFFITARRERVLTEVRRVLEETLAS